MRWLQVNIYLLAIQTSFCAAYDLDAVPKVPGDFKASIIAKEPDLLHPGALAFDARGRLFVGGGPQFRKPSPDTPPDSIKILIDKDGDGKVDQIKTFATGFNCIQALAWKGRDLWVANCPDVTIVRDLDGDDKADEFVLVFTGLGHLRHGLHGFNWAPDGRLYMSQGNSRAQAHAPTAFRELMHINSDKPDNQPLNKIFKPGEYKRSYIGSWPSSEGGVLRCDENGKNLEIFARGHRNPWDISFDDGFNWLGTDNDDGPEHDRIFMPFQGAHFGKMHAWSYSWTGKDNPPTVPMSGLFPQAGGSGVGVVYYTSQQFPEAYRNVFLIGDWQAKHIFRYRPKWDGALLTGELDTMVTATKTESLFRPTDIEVGPDGALYVAGWGAHYGSIQAPYGGGDQKAKKNEGRIFRIWYDKAPLIPRDKWFPQKRSNRYKDWSLDELIADLGHQIPVWRVNVQDELVRRGNADPTSIRKKLWDTLRDTRLTKAAQTWLIWTLGRIQMGKDGTDFKMATAAAKASSLNIRIQALRILALRQAAGQSQDIAKLLHDDEPRIRFEAAQTLRQVNATQIVQALQDAAAKETDRIAFYAQWRALEQLLPAEKLKMLLADGRGGVRRAALLALLENDALNKDQVLPLTIDTDEQTAQIAALWMSKVGKGSLTALSIEPNGGDFFNPQSVVLHTPLKGVVIHYTLDGTKPTPQSPKYTKPLTLTDDAIVHAGLFRQGKPLGGSVPAAFRRLSQQEWDRRLIVTNLKVESDKKYRLIEKGLKIGATVYIDRKYVYKKVPGELQSASYIMTSNDDGGKKSDQLIRFTINHDSDIYVAHDDRVKPKPSWMSSQNGFEKTNLKIQTSDTGFTLFRKRFTAGQVVLGGNTPSKKSRSSMYMIVLGKRKKAIVYDTKLSEVSPLIPKGNAQRGKQLFFNQSATGCYLCHRLEDKGAAIGPDLSDIGLRAKADYVAESIVDPNAKLIEGYMQIMIETKDGDVRVGLIREDSAKSLSLYQANGQQVTIAKKDIEVRRVMNISAMPGNFNELLSPNNVADLTAYLMTQKKKKPTKPEKK